MQRADMAVAGTAAALVFSRVFGLSVVLPDFRPHYEAAFAVELVWIGIAFGAQGLGFALAQWPIGALSDRFGRRPVLLAATLVFVAGSIAAALADTIAALIAALLLQGLGAVASVAMAMVGEQVDPSRRTVGMAMVGIPAGLGFFVGVGLGPVLYPIIGMRGLFLLTAAVGAAAALPLLRLRLGTPRLADAPRTGMPVIALALGGFVMNYALQTVLFFLPTRSPATLLPALAVALLGMAVASRAIDKAGLTWQPLAAGLLALAVAAPLFAFAPAGLTVAAAGAAFFAVHATLSAAFPSQVSRIAGAAGGRGHGIQNVVAYTGTFAGGAAAGALGHHPATAFVLLGVLAVAAAAFMVAQRRPDLRSARADDA